MNGRRRALIIANDRYGTEVLQSLLALAARADSVTDGRFRDSAQERYTDRSNADVRSSAEASSAEVATVRMWATWQEARVALVTGDIDHSLASFGRAAAAAPDDAAAEPIRKAGQFARRVAELRREQESHREAAAALRYAEDQVLAELLACVRAPGSYEGRVAPDARWSDKPAAQEMPGLLESSVAGTVSWRSRRGLLGLLPRRHAGAGQTSGSSAAALSVKSGEPIVTAVASPALTVLSAGSRAWPATSPRPVAHAHTVSEQAVLEGVSHRHPALHRATAGRVSRAVQAQSEVSVHLLGPMSVEIDDVTVDDWSSTRIRSLFGYLLTHRQPWPPREVLMEVFWPESSPQASRNSLNVAIHGLRRVLREAKDVPIIVYSGGAYCLHRDVRLWLDVEEFDGIVARGRRHEDAGEVAQATDAYELAAGLYRGEFLANDPYDDWAAPNRERLRLVYLDTLGRLSDFHFTAGRYATSASLCERIIEQDPCREEAYRRLMRCYSRQGQPHLALIQYRACVRRLQSELGVGPDLATVKLDSQIRHHEPV